MRHLARISSAAVASLAIIANAAWDAGAHIGSAPVAMDQVMAPWSAT
jgi:hypothetical protein